MTSLKYLREGNISPNNFLKCQLYFLNLQSKLSNMKDKQTIGQWLKWDFKINGDLEIRNKNDNLIYYENSEGFWSKREYDSQGNQIYLENSNGFWEKWEWDSQGNVIYFENSNGGIIDNRPPEVIEHNGRKYQLIP